MPTNKKKKKGSKQTKPKKETVTAIQIDLERLFDTLYDSIRLNPERRKELSLRAQREHEEKGRGMFVAHAFKKDGTIETNIEMLYQNLEWWNHERCVKEPLPEYLMTDPHYEPKLSGFMHTHDPYAVFIVSMTFRQKSIGQWGTTSNTLAHYRGPGTVYITHPDKAHHTLNAYEPGEQIGTTIEFQGRQCAAQDCDVMKGKRYVPTDCPDCGATAESCMCIAKQTVNNMQGKKLMLCSGCQQVAYCSKECQAKDWKARHKAVCKRQKSKKKQVVEDQEHTYDQAPCQPGATASGPSAESVKNQRPAAPAKRPHQVAEEPSVAGDVSETNDENQKPPNKKILDINLDREWTRRVATHVQTCGCPLQFLYSEQDGYALTDVYKCDACHELLTKTPCESIDEEGTRRVVRHSLLKKAALGIPIEEIDEQIIVMSADESEIAATLEEPFKQKMMDIELDQEWTRTVAEHVLKCEDSHLDFVSAKQDLFELVDRYRCRTCGETLCKRASRDVDGQHGLLRVEVNHRLAQTLAKDPPSVTVLQLYHMQQLSNMVCPTLEQLTELVNATKQAESQVSK